MQPIKKTFDELNRVAIRYAALKVLFSQFQLFLEEASKSLPVKGIVITTASTTESEVEFLDKRYVISFFAEGGHGLIEFSNARGVPSNAEPTQLALARFNGQGVLDLKQPASEDEMNLKEESCCINLLMNWLLQEAST